MELPDIGKHCGHSECKQLNFLPLQCKCGKVFCTEHFKIHCQDCEVSKFLSEDELKTTDNMFICSHPDCKEKSLIPIICEKCNKNFCVKHRHLTECEAKTEETLKREKEKYAAPVRVFNEAKAAVDKQLESSLNEAKKKSKTRDLANKVQLMKIKNKATGLKSIPSTDRVYFSVTYVEKNVPVFVSSQWSLGRVIDAIAQEMKLQNNNHISTQKKLKLFKKDDHGVISNNFSVSLKSLLEDKVIIDGDNLVIEYVDNN